MDELFWMLPPYTSALRRPLHCGEIGGGTDDWKSVYFGGKGKSPVTPVNANTDEFAGVYLNGFGGFIPFWVVVKI
jgi:hypothetical protein